MIERFREEDAQRAASEESKPPPQQKSEIIEIEKPYIGMPERYRSEEHTSELQSQR